jgi:hypothetical protein
VTRGVITFFSTPKPFRGHIGIIQNDASKATNSCIVTQQLSLATNEAPPKSHARLGRAMNEKCIGTVIVQLFFQLSTSGKSVSSATTDCRWAF